jgi:hypothetical protein
MAEKKPNPNCFIIMPISTPEQLVGIYNNDKEHFHHVLDCLFSPAIKSAGFIPLRPESSGSSIIHADIIKQLSTADLVLCDISSLNPNVFFEFGIRTALDKPVALVMDENIATLPFDTSPIHCHRYDSSLAPWLLEEQITQLSKHVQESFKKSPDVNPLWNFFGIEQHGKLRPGELTGDEKMDFIIEQIRNLPSQLMKSSGSSPYVAYSGWSGSANSPINPSLKTIYDLLAKEQLGYENMIREAEKSNIDIEAVKSLIIKSVGSPPPKKYPNEIPPKKD